MKRKIAIIVFFTFIVLSIFCINSVYASDEMIANTTKSQLVAIKDSELKSIEDYKELYGSEVYGIVAFVLNKVRVYSIPLGFLGISVSAIYQYIIGIRHLEARDKGFNSMITIVTVLIIVQILPLVFAIVVKGWRG